MTINGDFCQFDESGVLLADHLDGEWMPPEVMEVLNVEKLPVVYYEETSGREIVEDCQRSYHVGLTLIRAPEGKTLLVCLTTEQEIYVLNLVDLRQLKVFEELSKCDLRFYCVKGERIHFRLKEHCSTAFDYLINLTALDIFLSMQKKAIELRGIQKPYTLGNLSASSLPFHDKYELIKYWLGISVDKKSKTQEIYETRMIWCKPCGAVARNVIRFRCWFTRVLGVRISEAYKNYTLSQVRRLYDFALLGDESYEYFRHQIENGSFTYLNVLGALNQCDKIKNS